MLATIVHITSIIIFAILGVLPLCARAQVAASPPAEAESRGVPSSLSAMQQTVAKATAHGLPWNGPTSGPTARRDVTVALVCEDLRNGGILGVARGVEEAVKAIGWKVKVHNAGGSPPGRRNALAAALASKPDGLILVGTDAKASQASLLPFAAQSIPVVGWHVGAIAGPISGSPVAMNISTDPLDVARITAMAAVVEAKGRAAAVVFTDSNFEIAMAKANAMADIIRACQGCTLLEVRDVAISKSRESMPAVTKELIARYDARWTHALAINDVYFDYAAPELTKAGWASNSLSMLSAGDGSPAAFLRIRAGTFQTGTVAEPLNLHGWQLVDELNRLLASQPVSGYVAPVHLVTAANIAFDGGPRLLYDPDNGYRDIYRRIWKR